MKKKVIIALVGVLMLASGGYYFWSSRLGTNSDSGLAASLSGAASLDEGPAPSVESYDLTAHQTLSRVVILIKENYVDPGRIKPYEMFLAALDYVQKTVAEVMVDDSEAPQRIRISVGEAEHVLDLERLGGLDQLWEVTLALRDVFRFVQQHIDDPEQRRDVEYAAINGMLSSLDPHSILLKPESFDEVKLSTKGEFGGLGIVISIRDGALTVISPIEGTPASRAGIEAKDQIVKIDEDSTVNMTLEEAVHRLRGKRGTRVTIWVLRKGWTEPRPFTLTRAIIKIESVTSKLLDGGVGYIRIKSFQANTYDDLDSHLTSLREQNRGQLKGLVLDLRNNPGGLLDQAILVSDRFIEQGPLVITVGEGNRRRDVKTAHASGTEEDFPVAVLVNSGSASASEIVSGAIKNHDRGVVIGQPTFGKGSVQVLYDFKDRSALKLTIAQYLTPGDVSIQSIGIVPDVSVTPASISEDTVHLFANDDHPREKDLEHHLEMPAAVNQDRMREQPQKGISAPDEPVVRVVHLAEEDDEEDEEALEAAAKDEFEYDFEIGLAHDVLRQAKSSNREELLRESMALFENRASEQQQKIVARLKTLGVDWTTGTTTGPAKAKVSLRVKNSPNGQVKAGETLVLAARVTNVGQSPLYRVYGTTDSDNPYLKNLELVFGRIMPGETREWEVSVKLPKEITGRADAVVLELGDLHAKTVGAKDRTLVRIAELPRPKFAFRYLLDDAAKGNGDGVLQAGEVAHLDVTVDNVGPGVSADTIVTVKDATEDKAIHLKHGRAKLGKIAPGASSDAELEFSVRNAAEKVGLELLIWDNEMGELITEKLWLPVAEQHKVIKQRGTARVPSNGPIKIFSGASEAAQVIGHAQPGAWLRTDAAVGQGWLRVQLGIKRIGFVRHKDVKLVRGQKRKTSMAQIGFIEPQSAPTIDVQLKELVVEDPTLRINGHLQDERHIQDFFVFVNDKKVHYETFKKLEKTDDGVRAPLDVPLPLQPGSNTITLVARENKELASRRVFGVFLDKPAKVADRISEKNASP